MSKISQTLSEFLARWGARPDATTEDTDLFRVLRINGDDVDEFMHDFAKTYAVDLTEYRWFFHSGEEGFNFGGLFFPPPNRRVKRIAVTPSLLNRAIQEACWPHIYPSHQMPKVRWDLRLNLLILVVASVAIAMSIWQRFVR